MAIVVDGIGDQLFAGSAFASNHHGGIASGHLGDHLKDFAHLVAVADNIRNPIFAFQFISKPSIFFF